MPGSEPSTDLISAVPVSESPFTVNSYVVIIDTAVTLPFTLTNASIGSATTRTRPPPNVPRRCRGSPAREWM